MLVLGVCGGIDDIRFDGRAGGHDSAVVLVSDGQVFAAIEEERLNRIKHTDRFPARALERCLSLAGARIGDVDRVAIFCDEKPLLFGMVNALMKGKPASLEMGLDPTVDANPHALWQALIQRELGSTLDRSRIRFVNHHLCHAFSAFVPSRFDRALVVTMDGEGDQGESGYVATADGNGVRVLRTTPMRNSLGWLYTHVTFFLGFHFSDEFKVMGLAPYGDPAAHRSIFKQMYSLTPNGGYEIHAQGLLALATQVQRRRAQDPIEQVHKDLAAGVQEALEKITFHVLEHYRKVTGCENLCLAGGVAHNCTLNGKVLSSGLFSKVFVQPAAHDAGTALGAALYAACDGVPSALPVSSASGSVTSHVFLGTDIGAGAPVSDRLNRWGPVLSWRHEAQVAEAAARLLAAGSAIGWVQGRSEFGPRALGNRSILADPRPAENKQIINAMVKKREAFRPFAPAVLVERAAEYFEIPAAQADLGHMTYVLPVRPDKRALLGAVTHVDGSARVQTVSRADNPRFWQLIQAFGELTGVPVVLNTSFNNNAEPIVDTVDDAVVTFLTTKLNQLVIDEFIVEKAPITYNNCRHLVPSLRSFVSLQLVNEIEKETGRAHRSHRLLSKAARRWRCELSPAAWALLDAADGRTSLGIIVEKLGLDPEQVFPELSEVWSQRLINLLPPEVDQ